MRTAFNAATCSVLLLLIEVSSSVISVRFSRSLCENASLRTLSNLVHQARLNLVGILLQILGAVVKEFHKIDQYFDEVMISPFIIGGSRKSQY